MQAILTQLEIQNGLHTLANGVAAFFGSVFVIIVGGLLVKWVGGFLGPLSRSLQKLYRSIIAKAPYVIGTRYAPLMRWAIFVFWSVLCVALVAFAPPAIVLAALVAGLVIVFCILQHCLWDEDEKARDITGNAKHIDAKVDLRLETVCAVAMIFCLAAMGFSQLDRAYGVFAAIQGSPWWGPLRAALFVWGEVPEGVPIVDATSVYRNGNLLIGASYQNPVLASATLWLRIVYEIFVVAALFQLALVAQRLAEKGALGEIDRALKFGDGRRQNRAMTELTRLALRRQASAIQYLADMLGRFWPSPKLRLEAAEALFDVTERWSGIGRLYEIVSGYTQLLTELTEQDSPADWAVAQNSLGVVL